jgi:hypothetical protein
VVDDSRVCVRWFGRRPCPSQFTDAYTVVCDRFVSYNGPVRRMVQNIYELIVSLITLLIKHSRVGSHDLTFHR